MPEKHGVRQINEINNSVTWKKSDVGAGVGGGSGAQDGEKPARKPHTGKKQPMSDSVSAKGCLTLVLVIAGVGLIIYIISTFAPDFATLPRYLWLTDNAPRMDGPFNIPEGGADDGETRETQVTVAIQASRQDARASDATVESGDDSYGSDDDRAAMAFDDATADTDDFAGASTETNANAYSDASSGVDPNGAAPSGDDPNGAASEVYNAADASASGGVAPTDSPAADTNALETPARREYTALVEKHNELLEAVYNYLDSIIELDELRDICEDLNIYFNEVVNRLNYSGDDISQTNINLLMAAAMSDQIAATSVIKHIDGDILDELNNPVSDFNRNTGDAEEAYKVFAEQNRED